MNELTFEQYVKMFFSSPYYFITLILFSVITSFVTYLLLRLKIRLFVKTQDKIKIEQDKRDAFKLLLDRHSDLILGRHIHREADSWTEKYSSMSKDLLLWASDAVIANYGNYVLVRVTDKTISKREKYFAKTIMSFRKGIGYRNWFWRVKPEHIIMIFRAGYDKEI